MDAKRIAEEAYGVYSSGRHIDKPMLPSWSQLPDDIRNGWISVVNFITDETSEEIGQKAIEDARDDMEASFRAEFREEIEREVRKEIESERHVEI